MALPTVILFHNGKPVGKYNLTEYELSQFAVYLTHHTGLEPRREAGEENNSTLSLTESDLSSPLCLIFQQEAATSPKVDRYLVLAWVFALSCGLARLLRSSLFRGAADAVRRAWHEAEIQHEHQD